MNEICPSCGRDVANGIGPSALRNTTSLLNLLPSSKLFYDAGCIHDILYHQGTSERDRRVADDRFLALMLRAVELECRWYSRWFFRLQAHRNYEAVRLFGQNFFNYKGCQ